MRFKDFITRQRIAIFLVGIIFFAFSIWMSYIIGFVTLWGELFINLAASAITIVVTALIIDYLRVREEVSKTKNAAGLAIDEIRFICFRVRWSMARLFGLKQQRSGRNNISNRSEARAYLQQVEHEVTQYLESNSIENAPLEDSRFPRYLERLQTARSELEQTLILYQYAIDYNLMERVLNLRRELQTSETILGFIDSSDQLSEANISLIRIRSQSIYDEIDKVIPHDSTVT